MGEGDGLVPLSTFRYQLLSPDRAAGRESWHTMASPPPCPEHSEAWSGVGEARTASNPAQPGPASLPWERARLSPLLPVPEPSRLSQGASVPLVRFHQEAAPGPKPFPPTLWQGLGTVHGVTDVQGDRPAQGSLTSAQPVSGFLTGTRGVNSSQWAAVVAQWSCKWPVRLEATWVGLKACPGTQDPELQGGGSGALCPDRARLPVQHARAPTPPHPPPFRKAAMERAA